jgi:hypothetical protein
MEIGKWLSLFMLLKHELHLFASKIGGQFATE